AHRPRAAAGGLRVRVGRHGRGRGGALLDLRLLRVLDGDAPAGAPGALASAGGRAMRVLVVSGIWPPDVGGPASHAPEVADFLRSRGHEVEVVTTADSAPSPEPYPVQWVSRTRPVGVRHVNGLFAIARRGAARVSVDMSGR